MSKTVLTEKLRSNKITADSERSAYRQSAAAGTGKPADEIKRQSADMRMQATVNAIATLKRILLLWEQWAADVEDFKNCLGEALEVIACYETLPTEDSEGRVEAILHICRVANVLQGFAWRSLEIAVERGDGRARSADLENLFSITEWLLKTVAWLIRMQEGDNVLSSANSQAERAKRMRARRKAGYRMVNVAVHKTDIDAMISLGLLTSDEVNNQQALEDALQSYHAASFSMAYDDIDQRGQGRAPESRRIAWSARMIEFLEKFRPHV